MVLRPNSLKSIFVGRSLFARLQQEFFLTIANQQLVTVLEIFPDPMAPQMPVSEEEESEVEEEDSDASSMDVDSDADDSESADDEEVESVDED